MIFRMPVEIYEEENCIQNHAKELASLGKRALIVTGGHSSKVNGSLKDLSEALESQGIEWVVFDQVEENPSVETIGSATEFGRKHTVDFVVGLGGGSAMDASKAIALMLNHPNRSLNYLYEKSDSSTLPLVCIPTTCGTGSEVTGVSVLTRHDTKSKGSIPHSIFARYAMIDGKYLENAPKQLLANTAVDALAHLWESAVHVKSNSYSRMCVDAGLKAWKENKEILEGQKEANAQDLARMMRASAFAGMAIAQTGTSIPHGLSYSLTYFDQVPHGLACGYFLAGYLNQADKDLQQDLLERAGFSSLESWVTFYKDVCFDGCFSDEQLAAAKQYLLKTPNKLKNAPFPMDDETLDAIVYF